MNDHVETSQPGHADTGSAAGVGGVAGAAFGALAGILTPFFDSKLRERTEHFGNLVAYVDRLMLQYYPQFAWKPMQEAVAA